VSVYLHTLPHSWVFLLEGTLVNPCLGRKPKARVAIINNNKMKRDTLIVHKETIVVCEESEPRF
jgi:hypothetical protein